eukprot:scaffold76545_cov40-Prasinocladus_malaysianus.AAC.1
MALRYAEDPHGEASRALPCPRGKTCQCKMTCDIRGNYLLSNGHMAGNCASMHGRVANRPAQQHTD